MLSNYIVFPDKALAVSTRTLDFGVEEEFFSEFCEENEKCREMKARKKFFKDCK